MVEDWYDDTHKWSRFHRALADVQDFRNCNVISVQPRELCRGIQSELATKYRIIFEFVDGNRCGIDIQIGNNHSSVVFDERWHSASIVETNYRRATLRGLEANEREWVFSGRKVEHIRGAEIFASICLYPQKLNEILETVVSDF